jgi:hypothetical protein
MRQWYKASFKTVSEIILHPSYSTASPQIRYNGWTKLFGAVRDGDQEKALKLLSCLEPTEMLNGYPGPDMIADIRKYLEKKVRYASGQLHLHAYTGAPDVGAFTDFQRQYFFKCSALDTRSINMSFCLQQLFSEALPLVEQVTARFSVRHGVNGKQNSDETPTQFDVLFVQNKNDIGDSMCSCPPVHGLAYLQPSSFLQGYVEPLHYVIFICSSL